MHARTHAQRSGIYLFVLVASSHCYNLVFFFFSYIFNGWSKHSKFHWEQSRRASENSPEGLAALHSIAKWVLAGCFKNKNKQGKKGRSTRANIFQKKFLRPAEGRSLSLHAGGFSVATEYLSAGAEEARWARENFLSGFMRVNIAKLWVLDLINKVPDRTTPSAVLRCTSWFPAWSS